MKNILVTGCSRGIGFEIVKSFAKFHKANVLAIARNKDGLRKLEKECYKINSEFKLHILQLDLVAIKSAKTVFDYIKKNMNNSLDGIIHNAGFLVKKPFQDITYDELEHSFKINVFSPFLLTQKLMSLLNQEAHVLSISSMGGVQGSQKFPGLSAYSTSKSTLITFTECLAEEFKDTGFTFNCLALGAVQTEMLNEAFPGFKAPVSSAEMGDFIVNFYFQGSQYFNGQVIPVSIGSP